MKSLLLQLVQAEIKTIALHEFAVSAGFDDATPVQYDLTVRPLMVEKANVDLVVTGHTHGGEMRLPVIGPISPIGLPIQLPQEYDQGYHIYNDTPLFITSGLGTVGNRMRSFNPPEIVILTIE